MRCLARTLGEPPCTRLPDTTASASNLQTEPCHEEDTCRSSRSPGAWPGRAASSAGQDTAGSLPLLHGGRDASPPHAAQPAARLLACLGLCARPSPSHAAATNQPVHRHMQVEQVHTRCACAHAWRTQPPPPLGCTHPLHTPAGRIRRQSSCAGRNHRVLLAWSDDSMCIQAASQHPGKQRRG
jgi:hypothetical protein